MCLALICSATRASDFESELARDGVRVVRLRSFAPRASGRLEVEPTGGGGRVRLTAVNLPSPQTLAPNARTFVAWASGGRILRLGELRRDARGRGSLVFPHPSEFERYSLIVTAETNGSPERPTGAPIFSTRANELAAFFPARDEAVDTIRRERRATLPVIRETPATTATVAPSSSAPPATVLRSKLRTRAGGAASEFYSSVDTVVESEASARTLVLVGDRGARRARGTARVALLDGTAYVRVRFRRVPPASRFGRGRRYAMWALIPEDGTVYMGSLPARNLNRAQTYARTEGVNSDKFRLLVTAERRTPATRPVGRRVLMTFKGRRKRR
ncbi:MAG TPA: hypothetical protein VJT82_11780 [Pyrinomonadaceae bacterium]|nr:hypothetical protein [Pyrinomonadaceae bacterium]